MTSLETLSLTHAPISDRGLRELGRLHGLRSLYLADTLVTDVGLAHLSDFSNLRALDLSNTAVTDAGLPRITVLSGLRELNLQNTQVTDRGVAALKDALPCVRVLYESEAGAMSTWRKDMDEVASGATDRLVVCSVKFGDRHAPMLEELQELVSLDLFGSNLTDAALRHVGKLTRLRKLWLGYNHIRGPGLAHLAQLQQLRFLSLNHNPLSDDALAHLKQLSCLEELELHETPITDVGLEHLEALRRLKRLTWSASGPVSITPDGVNRLRAALPHTVVDVRW